MPGAPDVPTVKPPEPEPPPPPPPTRLDTAPAATSPYCMARRGLAAIQAGSVPAVMAANRLCGGPTTFVGVRPVTFPGGGLAATLVVETGFTLCKASAPVTPRTAAKAIAAGIPKATNWSTLRPRAAPSVAVRSSASSCSRTSPGFNGGSVVGGLSEGSIALAAALKATFAISSPYFRTRSANDTLLAASFVAVTTISSIVLGPVPPARLGVPLLLEKVSAPGGGDVSTPSVGGRPAFMFCAI